MNKYVHTYKSINELTTTCRLLFGRKLVYAYVYLGFRLHI